MAKKAIAVARKADRPLLPWLLPLAGALLLALLA